MERENFRDERILFSQMSLAEVLYILYNHIKDIIRQAKLTLRHSMDRIKQKYIGKKEVITGSKVWENRLNFI